jgi:hypothetical protein
LLAALDECGFIVRDGADIIAHDWAKTNGKLIANWHNGQSGGRRTRTQREPNGNPTVTHKEPIEKIEKIEEIDKTDAPNAREAVAELPDKAEVMAAAQAMGADPVAAEAWFEETSGRPITPLGEWTDRNGRPIAKWKHALKAYAVKWADNNARAQARQPGRPATGGVRNRKELLSDGKGEW